MKNWISIALICIFFLIPLIVNRTEEGFAAQHNLNQDNNLKDTIIKEKDNPRLIMEKVQNQKTGNNIICDIKMILINLNKEARHRHLRSFKKKKGDEQCKSRL